MATHALQPVRRGGQRARRIAATKPDDGEQAVVVRIVRRQRHCPGRHALGFLQLVAPIESNGELRQILGVIGPDPQRAPVQLSGRLPVTLPDLLVSEPPEKPRRLRVLLRQILEHALRACPDRVAAHSDRGEPHDPEGESHAGPGPCRNSRPRQRQRRDHRDRERGQIERALGQDDLGDEQQVRDRQQRQSRPTDRHRQLGRASENGDGESEAAAHQQKAEDAQPGKPADRQNHRRRIVGRERRWKEQELEVTRPDPRHGEQAGRKAGVGCEGAVGHALQRRAEHQRPQNQTAEQHQRQRDHDRSSRTHILAPTSYPNASAGRQIGQQQETGQDDPDLLREDGQRVEGGDERDGGPIDGSALRRVHVAQASEGHEEDGEKLGPADDVGHRLGVHRVNGEHRPARQRGPPGEPAEQQQGQNGRDDGVQDQVREVETEGTTAPGFPVEREGEEGDRSVEPALKTTGPVLRSQQLGQIPEPVHQVTGLNDPDVVVSEAVRQRVGVNQDRQQRDARGYPKFELPAARLHQSSRRLPVVSAASESGGASPALKAGRFVAKMNAPRPVTNVNRSA